jgi:hypothetical protein
MRTQRARRRDEGTEEFPARGRESSHREGREETRREKCGIQRVGADFADWGVADVTDQPLRRTVKGSLLSTASSGCIRLVGLTSYDFSLWMQSVHLDVALVVALVFGFQMAVGRPPKELVHPVVSGRW